MEMKSWYCCSLGDAMLADAALDEMKTRTLTAYAEAPNLNDWAVYYRHESEGRLHCELVVYFSPRAAHLAGLLSASICVKPGRQGLSLLVGDVSSWARLFPGS